MKCNLKNFSLGCELECPSNTCQNGLISCTQTVCTSLIAEEIMSCLNSRVRNATQGSGEKPTLFDLMSNTPINQPEGPIEKKLRETGEWIIGATEGPSRSAGQEILMTVCLKILPVWLLFLLIASGLFKLPFNNPALEDLIMPPDESDIA
ncbi:chlororespiratory reduction [Thalictrum thalictroides]|uniref:Chlororespiratory reduction n=1 Tax=Thalictrum thalictroides TaxID=46969 RepID=A0A7J6XEZ3_THATH|nr:chlororespiratory reduction [Thalictrum thalictroides]